LACCRCMRATPTGNLPWWWEKTGQGSRLLARTARRVGMAHLCILARLAMSRLAP
jgi:hypothetical protein